MLTIVRLFDTVCVFVNVCPARERDKERQRKEEWVQVSCTIERPTLA